MSHIFRGIRCLHSIDVYNIRNDRQNINKLVTTFTILKKKVCDNNYITIIYIAETDYTDFFMKSMTTHNIYICTCKH